MGAREKQIPDTAPAKRLAERLRELRRAAGTPSYRAMGKAIYVQHNTLSRVASGEYVTWPCVEQYLRGLAALGGSVSDDQVEELRGLWREGKRQHGAGTAATTEDRASVVMVDDRTRIVIFPSVPDLPSIAAQLVEPQYRVRLESGPATGSPRISTEQALVAALNDLVQSRRIDVRELRGRPQVGEFGRPDGLSATGDDEAWEVLTGRRSPTLPVVRRIVVDICGCPESQLPYWEAALHRTRLIDARPIESASAAGPVPPAVPGIAAEVVRSTAAAGTEATTRPAASTEFVPAEAAETAGSAEAADCAAETSVPVRSRWWRRLLPKSRRR